MVRGHEYEEEVYNVMRIRGIVVKGVPCIAIGEESISLKAYALLMSRKKVS